MDAKLSKALRAIDADAETPPTSPIVLRMAGDLLRTGLQIDVVVTWETNRLTAKIESAGEWAEASAAFVNGRWVLDGQGTVPYTTTDLNQPNF